MLSEDIRNLARRFERHEGGPLHLDAQWVEHFARVLNDLADSAERLEAAPVHRDLRPFPAGANVVLITELVHRRWNAPRTPEGAA